MDLRAITTLILDLDDTIYPVKSIGTEVFIELFQSLKISSFGYSKAKSRQIIEELWKRPMAAVAKDYEFPLKLVEDYHKKAAVMKLHMDITPFNDYSYIRDIHWERHLVTTGTTPVQQQKIDALNIRNDFTHILIDDPYFNKGGKEYCFRKIMQMENLAAEEILVIGDNPESEIACAHKMGIPAFHLDRSRQSPDFQNHILSDFQDLINFIDKQTF